MVKGLSFDVCYFRKYISLYKLCHNTVFRDTLPCTVIAVVHDTFMWNDHLWQQRSVCTQPNYLVKLFSVALRATSVSGLSRHPDARSDHSTDMTASCVPARLVLSAEHPDRMKRLQGLNNDASLRCTARLDCPLCCWPEGCPRATSVGQAAQAGIAILQHGLCTTPCLQSTDTTS